MSAADITDAELTSWRLHKGAYKRVAAMMTEWARGRQRGDVLPENSFFASMLDVVASPTVYKRARTFLRARHVLYRDCDGGPNLVA